MSRDGTVTYLYGDHLGSTSVAANASGTVTAQQSYYPYGGVRTGSLPTDFTFTGQRVDASASLMYYGARYYDTAIGRFIQPDSLIDDVYNPQSLNRYSYVHNNPVRYTDPTGHKICAEDCGPGDASSSGSRSTTIDPPASTGENQGTQSYDTSSNNSGDGLDGDQTKQQGGQQPDLELQQNGGCGGHPKITEVQKLADCGGGAGRGAEGPGVGPLGGAGLEPPLSLFRVVSDAELEDIKAFKGFRPDPNPGHSSMETKLFFLSLEDANKLAALEYPEGNFHIVEAQVQTPALERYWQGPTDYNWPTVGIYPEDQPLFNSSLKSIVIIK